MPDYRIFIHWGVNSRYEENLDRSLWNEIYLKTYREYLCSPTIEHLESLNSKLRFPVWGVAPKTMNGRTFGKAERDDLVLILLRDRLVAGARVVWAWRSPEVATGIWWKPGDSEIWDCAYALRDLVRYDITKEQVRKLLGYGPSSIRGFMRVAADKDPRPLLKELTENGGLPAAKPGRP